MMALGVARRNRNNLCVIFSDSMSALQAISHLDLDNQLVLEIVTEYTRLIRMDKHNIQCCVSSHVGMVGNEKADSAAKSGLNQSVINIRLRSTYLYSGVNELCRSEWQLSWDSYVLNKLHTIVPFLGANRNINGLR